ncbi:MAG: polysaccharide biosynthesis/export family protein [Bacteroidetes bacterium]|nr:polysaccharide biosynthesis/export family protein [Bacteroidota bacterium]
MGGSLVLTFFWIFLLTSCVSSGHIERGGGNGNGKGSSKVAYFNGIDDAVLKTGITASEPVIQKNDLLSITVSSDNPEASAIFNTPNQTSYTSSIIVAENAVTISGYLVNSDGDIQFPVLGTVHVAGSTKKQVTNMITQQLLDRKLLIDPIVSIRYLNFKVSVLGEVARPGVINIPNEKVTILEALGLAGDLTIYGKRDNVLLIREKENGDKIIKRINLGSEEILSSPYYYLKSNDVIYVEPNKNKIASVSRTVVLLPVILSGISLLIIAAQRL